jgi:hypothetical protein
MRQNELENVQNAEPTSGNRSGTLFAKEGHRVTFSPSSLQSVDLFENSAKRFSSPRIGYDEIDHVCKTMDANNGGMLRSVLWK